ncbi:MAG TPA: hypothetical protein VIT68_02215 [Candidatus Gracilibacteria bacterium]
MTYRIVSGKFTGLLLGLLASFFFLDHVEELNHPLLFSLGIEFWYAMMGGMIGMAGLWDKHAALNVELQPWIRGGLVGALMNMMLVCFIYDDLQKLLQAFATPISNDTSGPFIIMAFEGFVFGAIIDMVVSHFSQRNIKHAIRQKV